MTILGSVLTNESVESLSLLPQISSSEGDSYQQSSSCETTSASAIDDVPWSDFLIELDEIASPGHMSHCQEPLLDQAPEFSSDVPVSQQVTDALARPEDQPCESAKDEEVVFVASHQVSHAESVRSPHMRNQIVKGHKRRSEGVSRVRKSTRTAAKRFRDQYDERWIGERYKSLVEKIQTIAESGEQRLQQIVVEQRDLRRLHLDLQETVLNLERHVEERLDGLEDSQCCDKGLTEVDGIRKTLLLQLDSLNVEMSQFKRRLEGIGISVL